MRPLSWSRVRAVTQPRLELDLRLALEVLRALPDASTEHLAAVLPATILVATDGSVVVGAVRPEDIDEHRRYLAPESGEDGSVGIAPAIYSIGVLLFEAVTGYTFESPQGVEQELMGCRSMARAAGLGEEFWELLLLEAAARATRENPEERWPAARDFARAIERAAGRHVSSRHELADLVFEAASAIGPSQRPLAEDSSVPDRGARESAGIEADGSGQANPSSPAAAAAVADEKRSSSAPAGNDTAGISNTESHSVLDDASGAAGIDPQRGAGAGGTKRTLLGIGDAVPDSPTTHPDGEAPEMSTGASKQTLLGLGLAAGPNSAWHTLAVAPGASPTSGESSPDDGSVPALAQQFDSEAPTLTRYPAQKRRVGRVLLAVAATSLLVLLALHFGGYLTRNWQSLAPHPAAPPAAAVPLESTALPGSGEAAGDSAEHGEAATRHAPAAPSSSTDGSKLVVVPCSDCESDAAPSAAQDAGAQEDAAAAVQERKTAPRPMPPRHKYRPPERDYGI